MKSYWKTAGLVALGAALMYYPAMRLYKYVASKAKGAAEGLEDEADHVKHIFNHRNHNPHHRKAATGN